jgi:RNA polymerase sigma factor (TIGR02999 family)
MEVGYNLHGFCGLLRCAISMTPVTQLLRAAHAGDRQAAAELLPLVYDELRKLAGARMAAESPDHTLQPTALVHEAYLRLVGPADNARWDNRGHFFAAAAEAMRRILVETARRKKAVKHGGGRQRLDTDTIAVAASEQDDDLVAIDAALDRLADLDPAKAELVKLRYFAGLSIAQAAEALGISPATAKRHWAYSRAWLFEQVSVGGNLANP